MNHATQPARTARTILRLLCVLGILSLSAATISCQQPSVRSISWYDAKGSRLNFTGSFQGSNEAGFASRGEKKRYILDSPIQVPDGYATRLLVSSLSSGTQFLVSYGDEKNRGGSLLCTIPAAGSYAFIIPPPQSRTLKWIEIKAVTIATLPPAQTAQSSQTGYPLALQEIRLAPEMRGLLIQGNTPEISPQFSRVSRNGSYEYSIDAPFDGLSQTAYAASQLDVALSGDAGNVAVSWGSQKLTYLHRGGNSAFSIPNGLLEPNPKAITLDVPSGIRVAAFCVRAVRKADELDRIDPGLLVNSAPLADTPFYFARWDMRPDTLLFLFKDYATQDRYLKRLAFFVEKIGYVGKLATDAEIADQHGWNAHDYRPEDLARFFETAQEQHFPLSEEELSLRDILVKAGILIARGSNFSAGKGAIVSISQESATYLQYRFLSHELSHALFFTDTRYRDLVLSLYQRLTDDEKWFLIRYFRWMRYNVDSSYLMANEMQAYLVQQPLKDIQNYFLDTLGSNLAKAHPELSGTIDAYMSQHLSALIEIARQLGAYLRASYGLEPGMLYKMK